MRSSIRSLRRLLQRKKHNESDSDTQRSITSSRSNTTSTSSLATVRDRLTLFRSTPGTSISSMSFPPTSSCGSGSPPPASYSRALKIPYLQASAYVFPDAGCHISKEHQDRFPVLKSRLQENVEESPKLDCEKSVHYELRMCGKNPHDAAPSILVYCPAEHLQSLKSLLTQQHLKDQYKPTEVHPHLPQYRVYFWGQTGPLVLLSKGDLSSTVSTDELRLDPDVIGHKGFALCGAPVLTGTPGTRRSTMACLLWIDSRCYGLTTAHAFKVTEPGNDEPIYVSIENRTINADVEFSSDDGHYTIPGEFSVSKNPSPTTEAILPELSAPIWPEDGLHIKCTAHFPPSDEGWNSRHTDLDWALLECFPQPFEFYNSYYTGSDLCTELRLS